MKSKKLTFTNAQGDELAAQIDLPENGDPETFVLFAHCFTCSKNLKAVSNIARALTDKQLGVFRFDFTGLGESEGDFSDTNFPSNIGDLVKAAEFMEADFKAPAILVGHSLGGAAVLLAAHKISSCKAVATIAAPCDPDHVIQNFEPNLDEIKEDGQTEVVLEGRSFTIKKQFLDDLEELKMGKRIKDLEKALLIFHSPVDQQVSIENAGHIFRHAKHPKSFISLDDANHLLNNENNSRYVGTMLASWAYTYI